jgi:hypothetical protein
MTPTLSGGLTGLTAVQGKTGITNAQTAGLTMDATSFEQLDPTVRDFFARPPKGPDPTTGTQITGVVLLQNILSQVKDGSLDANDAVSQINTTSWPDAVKTYLISQINAVAPAASTSHWYNPLSWGN